MLFCFSIFFLLFFLLFSFVFILILYFVYDIDNNNSLTVPLVTVKVTSETILLANHLNSAKELGLSNQSLGCC